MEMLNLLSDRTRGGCYIKLVRGHKWIDSWHIRVSPGEGVLVSLKHASEQFQFILHEQRASVGNLICAM